MDKEILKELGLTNNEVEVYLTLLRKGSITVNTIAEKSGLHRQACYDALDRLLEKGFVSFVIQNNKKYFQGIKPDKILNILREKEDKFKTILQNLIDLTKLPREDTFVEVFKGKGTIRAVYRDIAREFEKKPGDLLISGVDERKFMEADNIALEQHLSTIRRLKCKEKVLVKEGENVFLEGKQTIYKAVPKESFTQTTPTFVYNNKFTIVVWGNPMYAIVIENKDIAETYRRQFNHLWKTAKKVKK